jgi:hypothetical protein
MAPLSAYALCYIPLAAMIVGLLVAFAYTDWDARKPYNRVLPGNEQAGTSDRTGAA